MKITYVKKNFARSTLETIETANRIINEYQLQGYSLTLRQLYYQLVARDILPNSQKSYKRLGSVISDGRRAGLVDWDAIEDRTRNLRGNNWYSSPTDAVESLIKTYVIDKWQNQPYRVEVWIEKDALTGVIGPVCKRLDVDYFSCRGYSSDSEMWRAGHRRIKRRLDRGQETVIIHLGDHDPSGLDMTRDIVDRLRMFSGVPVNVFRAALNRDQIDEFNPPPNPAKITDSRATKYIKVHGRMSWELDALDPSEMSRVIERAVSTYRDDGRWAEMVQAESDGIRELKEMIAD